MDAREKPLASQLYAPAPQAPAHVEQINLHPCLGVGAAIFLVLCDEMPYPHTGILSAIVSASTNAFPYPSGVAVTTV